MKVELRLSALTRVEHTVEVEVPDGTPDSELDDMVRQAWTDSDGGEFVSDPDYFERGHCYWVISDGSRKGETSA